MIGSSPKTMVFLTPPFFDKLNFLFQQIPGKYLHLRVDIDKYSIVICRQGPFLHLSSIQYVNHFHYWSGFFVFHLLMGLESNRLKGVTAPWHSSFEF